VLQGRGPLPPLYGVVVKKGNLVHYGKIDKMGKCPFFFHAIVMDQDKTCVRVTFWATSAAWYFPRIGAASVASF
jgi:hypothetical protein